MRSCNSKNQAASPPRRSIPLDPDFSTIRCDRRDILVTFLSHVRHHFCVGTIIVRMGLNSNRLFLACFFGFSKNILGFFVRLHPDDRSVDTAFAIIVARKQGE